MRIETMTAGVSVDVNSSGQTIELAIGEPTPSGAVVARLSIGQAEMVLHALGFQIAHIREQDRRSAEQRQHLAQVVAETEVHRR